MIETYLLIISFLTMTLMSIMLILEVSRKFFLTVSVIFAVMAIVCFVNVGGM